MHRVLIAGDREYGNSANHGDYALAYRQRKRVEKLITLLYRKYGKDLVIIEGGARGADTLARDYALGRGIPVMEFPAPWDYLPRAGGLVRNKWMLKIGKPHEVWIFHPCIDASKGSKDMAKQAVKAGLLPNVIQ
jgi:hypothetical protein